MAEREDIRQIALALPEAVEADHHGMPSFRVGGKIFCTLHAEEHRRCMVKLDPEDQHNLCDDAAVTRVPGYWGLKGSTFVAYEQVTRDRLAELIRLAWATAAPKRLLQPGP